ncbi:hypothetical protein CANARDRAFT_6763 [[Candida] arabinofermentans NRRL YB-2248]|uniref:Actin-related protein 4 n=1 Tax=[Candida] arabinofermentans NRRL YB-2248 TaxID=983967 RepID=A0A1E4T3C2_9ASCO|nr:hypothetical protein CANARDRAFT_6763 [[Candida] arabinofermentans NRRL YB-2248]
MSFAASTTAAPQVYGADEINGIVLDPGTYTTKIGFAGYDSPSLIIPSYYGEVTNSAEDGSSTNKRVFGENSLYTPKANLEIKPLIKNNIVVDWDASVEQYQYLFKQLSIDPADQPLLLTESTLNSYKNKEQALQVFLEQEQFSAFYMVKQPTCVSFAHGRPNCLVVDIGHDIVTVTPIIDGICLKNQVMGTKYAGAFLNQQFIQFLNEKKIVIDSTYKIKSKKSVYWENEESKPDYVTKQFDFPISESFDEFAKLRTLQEMKETLLAATIDTTSDAATENGETGTGDKSMSQDDEDLRYFEIQNGLSVPFTKQERTKISNSLFDPLETLCSEAIQGWETPHNGNIIKSLVNGSDKTSKEYVPLRRTKKPEEEDKDKMDIDENVDEKTSNGANETENDNVDLPKTGLGLSKLIQAVLDKLDVDLKPQLANNIILTGSTSLIPGLNSRLHSDLTLSNPSLKIRIHSAGNTIERKYASWIGGSILSSLGTFHQLWVSKAEYEEVGAERLIVSRFR